MAQTIQIPGARPRITLLYILYSLNSTQPSVACLFFLRLNNWLQYPGLTWMSIYLRVHQFKVLREDYHEPLPEITELPSECWPIEDTTKVTPVGQIDSLNYCVCWNWLELIKTVIYQVQLDKFCFYFIIFSFYLKGGSTPKWLNKTGPLRMLLLRRLSTRTFEVLVDLKTLIITEKILTLEIIDPWQLSGKVQKYIAFSHVVGPLQKVINIPLVSVKPLVT